MKVVLHVPSYINNLHTNIMDEDKICKKGKKKKKWSSQKWIQMDISRHKETGNN